MKAKSDKSNEALATVSTKATREEKDAAIRAAIERKKAQAKIDERIEVGEDKDPPKGSKAEKKANATKPGVVKPSKPDRKTKIPKELNVTADDDDTDTTTEGTVKEFAEKKAKQKADKELDKGVADAKKPKKKEKDPNMLSVSDVARELGLDPKRARAKLRASGQAANEGRWPLVKRDSDEHEALIAILKPAEEVEGDETEIDDEDEE